MDSLLQSIKSYEEQQKSYRHQSGNDLGKVQNSMRREVYHLSSNIVKVFEDQKKDYETKIAELRAENKELLSKFNEILAAVTAKKTDDEEIADLQTRIQAIYNKKRSL